MAVCDSARHDPAGPTTVRAVTVAKQTIGFTGFMKDNSTRKGALKIRSMPESLVVPVTNPVTYYEPACL